MQDLNYYTEQATTELFKKYGAFFAFGNDQFQEKMTKGVSYVHCGAGLIVPKKAVNTFIDELDKITQTGIEKDLAENGKKAVIHRELANHEAQISMDIFDTVCALANYPITENEIKAEFKEFFQNCVDNDLF